VQIDFDFLERVPSLNPTPETDLQVQRHGRHLEKRYEVITAQGWFDLDEIL